MRKLFPILLVAAIIGGYFFFQRYQVVVESGQVVVRPKVVAAGGGGYVAPTVERQGGTIRIASFNIQVFGLSKLNKPRAMQVLAEAVRNFDVVAIQEVRSKSQDILPRFIDLINSTGRHYDYLIGPRLGRTDSKEQYAFIFDTDSIETDRTTLYTVKDPDDLLHREPLVGWFRVRGPPAEQAFTFTLVDIHTDPDEASKEVDALADVFRRVRDDGRGEDDVILLGDLNEDEHHLGKLAKLPNIRWAITGVPTNTRGDKMYDNIIFSESATSEFTGRAGVLDMMREYNLTLADALEVSDHLPVWAEFSIYEGGQAGRIATRPSPAAK